MFVVYSWTGPDSSSFIHHKKKHAEPVHNVHQVRNTSQTLQIFTSFLLLQETKHGPFTNMSQAQGTISNTQHDQKPQLQLQPDLKPIVSLHGAATHHQEIKLIHSLTKIPHNPL